MSSSSNRFDLLEKDPSRSKEQETHMRITDLPAEIRNEIYRYLLARDYVRERSKNPDLWEFGGIALGYHRPEHKYAGSLLAKTYGSSVLATRSTVYASAVKSIRNPLSPAPITPGSVFVSTVHSPPGNSKNRGFDAIRLNSTQGMKVCILALAIRFPPQRFGSGSNTFVMSTTDAGKLQRALSTVTGLDEMQLTFIASPDFPKESNPITKAFLDLRGVGIASVCGPSSRHSLGMMTRTISTPLVSTSDDKDAILELAQGRV